MPFRCANSWCGFMTAFLGIIAPVASVHAQLPPQEELNALEAVPGMELSLFAAEPMITNPSAIDVDTHGRVWVAEIEWYRSEAKDPPADKIKVLEDTDGDGQADRVTVFADGLFCPMSVCVAGDKVYVATSPDLWVYEDKDGDLVADGPPTKLLTGFGGYNHDHGAHSLVLGPDHKWWMSHGDRGFNVTGTDGSRIEFEWGAVIRGELDGSQLENVAVNFRNPYEVCVSSFGESFLSDNDNDGNFSTRICWVMEGGDYGWFGQPGPKVAPGTPFSEGWHFRAPTPGFVPGTLVTGFGSPCGMCFYEGDAFGPDFKNVPLHVDAGPREVRRYPHEVSGSGMQARNEVLITTAGDSYFRPSDICAAPDGSLFIADWYDGGVGGHAYNNPRQGRIFVARPPGGELRRLGKPGPFANVADAIGGLKNPNLATQYLARERLLAEGETAFPALDVLLESDDANYRARALWVFDRIGGAGRDRVVAQLNHPEASFRALAVRILRRHGAEYGDLLLAMAADDSAEVRREVLLALPKLQGPRADEALLQLASTYDGADRYLLEAIHIAAAGHKASLARSLETNGRISLDNIQLLQVLDPEAASEFLSKRMASVGLGQGEQAELLNQLGGTASAEAGEAVLKLAGDDEAPAELRRMALRLLTVNLDGNWRRLREDEQLAEVVGELLEAPAWQRSALELVAAQRLEGLGDAVLAVADSPDTKVDVRRRAIEVAAQLRAADAGERLRTMVTSTEAAVRSAAVAALVDLQDWAAVEPLLGRGTTSDELRHEAADRMIASTGGALALLRMIDNDALPAEVRASVINRAADHPDANVRTLFERFLPEDQRPKPLGSVIKPKDILALDANSSRGEKIFFQSSASRCKECHRVRGVGGTIGPDLSQIGRKYERAALLETILNPSKAIAPEFVSYLLESDAGQLYAGFVVEKNDREVVLKDAQGHLIRVPNDEVVTLAEQKKSIMPELVLRDATAQDAADLLGYMMSLTESMQTAAQFRVLGPFANPPRGEPAREDVPNKQWSDPDLAATYRGLGDEPLRWELVDATNLLGFPAFDQVQYDERRGLRANEVVHYVVLFADSPADQDATLLLGTDDGCQVWVNGRSVHRFGGRRLLNLGDDRINVRLEVGRNVIAIKVIQRDGPGGVALSVASPQPVELRAE